MKRMDLFCSSPSSTAICSTLDHRSMVRRATTPKDRLINSKTYISCSSESPIHPNPYYHQKKRNSSSNSGRKSYEQQSDQLRRKSSADITDHVHTKSIPYIDWISESAQSSPLIIHSKPPRSSSYSASRYNYAVSESRTLHSRTSSKSNHSPALKSSSSARSRDQVVVLWVSIHCKGCEGKVRKHISKMEGVRSFNIDLATKKVTVVGNVTPLGVLASLSKVKNAQLWPSQSQPSPFST
ncbi:protein SODIUM POTASSIUM ROOT DEFECTIVE 2 isoform X2 [Euphorbia lathyris]|uniref:protein SODIUM POTASSIUM ROOT DEFECTIVE 2 isoform X2 n=1 Tax=Euphorbia lathyris TaxID=212925 RepID=UPI003313B500